MSYSDADYFNLSDRDSRIARTRLDKPAPSLEQVRHATLTMPAETAIERRDRALVAFILLTGARDGAARSIRVKHVDLATECIVQDAREVATKNGKTIPATFFPVGDDIRKILEDWIEYLTTQLHWGPDDPLFPATRVEVGPDHSFRTVGLDRRHWTTAEPIRDIFRRAFDSAGLPYYPPHRLRKTLVLLGEVLCKTPEDFKAWSQNLGHSDVLTTFTSYGNLTATRQGEVIRELGRPQKTDAEALNMLQEGMKALLQAR